MGNHILVNGYFPLGDTDRLSDTLVLNFGLRAEHVKNDVIYLSAAPPAGPCPPVAPARGLLGLSKLKT